MIHCIASRCQPVTSLRRSLLLGGGISATCRLLRSRVQGVCARDATHSHKRGGRCATPCATPGPRPDTRSRLAMACARCRRSDSWPDHSGGPGPVSRKAPLAENGHAGPACHPERTPMDLLIVDVLRGRWTGVGPTQFPQEDRPKPSMVAVTFSRRRGPRSAPDWAS